MVSRNEYQDRIGNSDGLMVAAELANHHANSVEWENHSANGKINKTAMISMPKSEA
jgi:hypothetical protein